MESIYKRTVIKKILTHLNLYEEQGNQRAPPISKENYTERVEVIPYDDGWPEHVKTVVEFKKINELRRDGSVQIEVK